MKEVDKLNCLKFQIEKLEQSKQIEILRIIVNAQKISINEKELLDVIDVITFNLYGEILKIKAYKC